MKKLFFLFLLIFSLGAKAQLSTLIDTAKNFNDSNIVNNNTRLVTPKKMHDAFSRFFDALHYIDTAERFNWIRDTLIARSPATVTWLSSHKYAVGIDTNIVATRAYANNVGGGGGGSGPVSPRYLFSSSAPTDTTVGWIDSRYNFLECYPIHYRVNGAWSNVDTIAGPMYDLIGHVFTRGKPIVIYGTGQSNIAGPYIDAQASPGVAPYNSYYGDTASVQSVSAWDYGSNSWKVGHIRQIPFNDASGANYLLLTGKKITKHTGSAVRIVMTYSAGTGLECWSAQVGGNADTATCLNAFKAAITASGATHPDLMIWGQGESSIGGTGLTDTAYYHQLRSMIANLRSNHYLDSSTLILCSGTGDKNYGGQVSGSVGATGDGALRAIGADDDLTTVYVPSYKVQTDSLHFTPKGHEQLADEFFYAWLKGPLSLSEDFLGYKWIAPHKLSSEETKQIMDGTNYVNAAGNSYFSLVINALHMRDPYEGTAGSGAGIYWERLTGAGTLYIKDYAGDALRFPSNGYSIWDGANGFIAQELRSQNGSEAKIKLYDTNTANTWSIGNLGNFNLLHTRFNDTVRSTMSKDGDLRIGNSSSLTDPSAKLELLSTTKGFLGPRMTATQMNAISSPSIGLMVFNLTDSSYYQYNGSVWQNLYNSSLGGGSAHNLISQTVNATDANFTAVAGTAYIMVDASHTRTITLPGSSLDGDIIEFYFPFSINSSWETDTPFVQLDGNTSNVLSVGKSWSRLTWDATNNAWRQILSVLP